MTSITLKLAPEELKQLAALAADQLFRKEFIDTRMPGYKADAAEINRGKELVGRLRLMIDGDDSKRTSAPRIIGSSHGTAGIRRYKGVPKSLK